MSLNLAEDMAPGGIPSTSDFPRAVKFEVGYISKAFVYSLLPVHAQHVSYQDWKTD